MRNGLFKKGFIFGIFVLFIGIGVIQTPAEPLEDEVEIKIFAGILGFALDTPPLGGNIGFGTSVHIINNGSQPVTVYERYEYWNLFGKYLGVFGLNYIVQPNSTERSGDFGWPWGPVYLKITVEAGKTIASRTGFSICNFVILHNN